MNAPAPSKTITDVLAEVGKYLEVGDPPPNSVTPEWNTYARKIGETIQHNEPLLKKIDRAARWAADEQNKRNIAFEARRTAKIKLLSAMIEAIHPALPGLCGRSVILRSRLPGQDENRTHGGGTTYVIHDAADPPPGGQSNTGFAIIGTGAILSFIHEAWMDNEVTFIRTNYQPSTVEHLVDSLTSKEFVDCIGRISLNVHNLSRNNKVREQSREAEEFSAHLDAARRCLRH